MKRYRGCLSCRKYALPGDERLVGRGRWDEQHGNGLQKADKDFGEQDEESDRCGLGKWGQEVEVDVDVDVDELNAFENAEDYEMMIVGDAERRGHDARCKGRWVR